MASGRTRPLTDEEAQRALTAFRAGKTPRQICGGMVGRQSVPAERIASYELFCAYRDSHPAYAVEANALLAEAMKTANARKGARLRNRPIASTVIHSLARTYTFRQTAKSVVAGRA